MDGTIPEGRVGWRTCSAPIRRRRRLPGGVAEMHGGGSACTATRAGIYYVLEGSGIVTLDGVEHPVTAGAAVFIPGDCAHGIRNDGAWPLRFLYAFAVDSFGEVEYRFS